MGLKGGPLGHKMLGEEEWRIKTEVERSQRFLFYRF